MVNMSVSFEKSSHCCFVLSDNGNLFFPGVPKYCFRGTDC